MDFDNPDLNPKDDSDWNELEAGNANSGLGSVRFDPDSRDSTEDSDEFDDSE